MFSKLIFGYGKLITRIYFAQIVIHIKIDFDFFIPSRVRIDHSAMGFKCTQDNAHLAKFESNTNRMTFEYAPNMMIVKVHPLIS